MQISKDTKAVIDYLDAYTNGNLRKKNDLASLLELSANNNDSANLNKLIFSGKSVWNIYNKIKKFNPSQEGLHLLEKELSRNSEDMLVLIDIILQNSDDETNERFEKIYFAESAGALKNIIDLANDLSALKNLQSEMKLNKE